MGAKAKKMLVFVAWNFLKYPLFLVICMYIINCQNKHIHKGNFSFQKIVFVHIICPARPGGGVNSLAAERSANNVIVYGRLPIYT